MATDQSTATVDQEQWQDYKPPPQGDSDWQDYKPAATTATSFRAGTTVPKELKDAAAGKPASPSLTAPIDTEAKNPISRTLSSAGGTVIGALSHPIDAVKSGIEGLGDIATLGLTEGSPIGESMKAWANPKTRPTWEGIKSVLPEALGQGIGTVAAGELGGEVARAAGPPIVRGLGVIPKSIAERNPVVRGTQAYQKIIAPATSKAIEQMDDVETIRRAMPYLGEQERLTPVKPGAGAGPKGQKLGVLNYRQNADMAADKLWNEKIAPIQGSYDAAPIDSARVSQEIRATHDPNAPPNAAKAQAVSDLADHYNQPTTIKDALAKVKALNEDRQVAAYEKALPDQQAAMIRADPAIEAKVQAANSLREAVFDSIEQHGSPQEAEYIREARKDFGALKQVSKNLANAPVPTPGSFVDKLLNTARVALRPRSATAPVAETLFNDPNKLAAKSSRLFGAADVPTRATPPLRTTPWAPPAPAPFIPPPAPPQAPPNAAGQVTGIGSIQNPQAVGTRGTAGTRFAPKGLLPGPIAGTPVPQVGNPAPVGFPARIGLWEGFPNPNAAGPGFEPLPRTPVTVQPAVKPLTPPEIVKRGTIAPQVPTAEPVTPPKGSTSVLPGMEEHVAKQAEGAAKVKGEDLTREANTPKDINVAAGELETKSPLFRGTEASPQREIFGVKTEPTPAATATKPLREEYSPQEIEEAELMLKQEVGATKAGETPRRMFHESEAGDVRTGSRQIRGGDWQGVKSGRNLFPFLKAYPEFTASMIEQALKRPNSPTYERIVSRAAKLIRDEKLTTEQKGQRFEAEQANPNRPANALDLIEGLKAFRKPKL
jgi:hypothetical protein